MNDFVFLLYFASVLLFIFYFILKKNYSKIRGYYGEMWVKKDLNKLSKDNYIVLNDILIKDDRGTHQIDHIVISNKGIFVIEMKNYYGLIVGDKYKEKWTQYLGHYRTEFYNPLRQNYGHIKALSKLLNLDDKLFISIVCFSNNAKLSIKHNEEIVNFRELIKKIKNYDEKNLDIDMHKCNNIILLNNISNKKIRKKHIKKIKEKYNLF